MIKTTQKLKTACTRDCPDACGIIATVEDNRVVRIQGDPEHPITQGFLCKRTSRFLRRQYDPDRITQPMIRRDKKSDATWEPVSLEAALDLAAERLLHFRDNFGPASIMNYRCGGSMGIMKATTDYFFQEFGPVTIKSGDVCAGAGDAAQEIDFGIVDSHDVFDLYNSNTILIWGKNVYCSHVHLLPVLKKAKSQGCTLILIDPVKHRTASLCDEYVQVRPGGDMALAFGMARWLLDHEHWDSNAQNYCDHFVEYRSVVLSKSVKEWSELAGIDSAQLSQLASAYGQGPSAILVGWGMQRRRHGCASIRAIDALTAVSGNLGISGGGVSFYFPRRSAFNTSFVDDSLAPRRIPEPLFGPGIEAAKGPRIEMVWVTAGNPVAMIPDSKTIQRALMDRFTVVVDCFMTDTAQCADIFLPTTTMLEEDDFVGAYGHHYLNEVKPVVRPPEGVLTDYQILQEIAKRVGIGGWFNDDTATWKHRLFADLRQQGFSLEQLQTAPIKNPAASKVLFADRKFPTSSGKVNLIHDFNSSSQIVDEFPLKLMAISTADAQGSQWSAEAQTGKATVVVHPEAANGFNAGDLVRLTSDLDSIEVYVDFDAEQRTDIAIMNKGGWLSEGRCANVLTRAELTDKGECAVYYDTPVRLEAIR